MLGKISKDDLKYLLLSSKKEIAHIFDLLDEPESLDILSFLYNEAATYENLKAEFSYFGKDILSNYVVKLWDFAIIELDRKDRYQLSKTGRKFLEITAQIVFEAYLNNEFVDETMNKIFIQQIGKKELTKFKKERQDNKAKGIQLGTYRI